MATAWLDEEVARVAPEVSARPWKFFNPGDDLFLATDWIARNFPPMVRDSASGNVILTRQERLAHQTIEWYFATKIPERLMLEPTPDVAARGLSPRVFNGILARQMRVLGLGSTQMRPLSSNQIKRAYDRYSRRQKHHQLPFTRSSNQGLSRRGASGSRQIPPTPG